MTDLLGMPAFIEGLSYPESPRWHDGRLWISDVHSFSLKAFDVHGAQQASIAVPGRPAGTGFTPDGEMIVATAVDRKLTVVRGDRLVELADLSGMTTGLLNDMVVDTRGRAYVGDTGFRYGTDDPQLPGRLILVEPDGASRIVAEDVVFPNGVVLSPDGATMYLAETFAERITAFDVAADGSLSNRRVHAPLRGTPDGICLDDAGGLWIALLAGKAFVRIDADGRETDRFDCGPRNAIACMIGGEDRRTLFLCHAEVGPERRGFVTASTAPFAAAGLP
jgi:sugar lactone lactonase YvrE